MSKGSSKNGASYLPHFGVESLDKETTKLHIVYDRLAGHHSREAL